MKDNTNLAENDALLQRILVVLWVIVFSSLYYGTIDHLYPIVTPKNNIVFGADTLDAVKRVQETSISTGDFRKHPLAFLVFRNSVLVLNYALSIRYDNAIKSVLMFFAIVNMIFMLFILTRLFTDTYFVLVIGVFYGLAFANLVMLSIPESYFVSQIFILYFVYLFVDSKEISNYRAAVLGLAVGLAGLCNPPLLTLALIPTVSVLLRRGLRDAALAGALMLFGSLVIFVGVQMALYGDRFYLFYDTYAERYAKYASLYNFFDPINMLNVAISFIIYSVIAPPTGIKAAYSVVNAEAYLRSMPALVVLIGYITILCCVIRNLMYCKNAFETAIALWIVSMMAFYVYFNPVEAILYSVQVLPLLLILIATSLSKTENRGRIYIFFIIGLVGLGWNNLDAFRAP
jgi:hypothetical protein